jgi:ABC-type transport system involved in multi-copper enzyme maturation permease subunit
VKSRVAAIARYTFLEALRNRLFGLTAAGLLCLLGITEFIGELAITESAQLQAAFIGAGMRLFAVCTVALFVITSLVREANDKGFEVLLSLPVPRHAYFFGKFLGFLGLAVVISAATCLLLLVYSEPVPVLYWFASLQCELAIVVALALLFVFTFNNVTVAFMLVLAFYLLSRSMHAIQLISSSPILESGSFSQQFINLLLDGVAFVLPDLHEFTRSDWLARGGGPDSLAAILGQALIFVALLGSAAIFDLYRKEL